VGVYEHLTSQPGNDRIYIYGLVALLDSTQSSFSISTFNNSVANMKRKKSIELSKGEAPSLYTREPGTL